MLSMLFYQSICESWRVSLSESSEFHYYYQSWPKSRKCTHAILTNDDRVAIGLSVAPLACVAKAKRPRRIIRFARDPTLCSYVKVRSIFHWYITPFVPGEVEQKHFTSPNDKTLTSSSFQSTVYYQLENTQSFLTLYYLHSTLQECPIHPSFSSSSAQPETKAVQSSNRFLLTLGLRKSSRFVASQEILPRKMHRLLQQRELKWYL